MRWVDLCEKFDSISSNNLELLSIFDEQLSKEEIIKKIQKRITQTYLLQLEANVMEFAKENSFNQEDFHKIIEKNLSENGVTKKIIEFFPKSSSNEKFLTKPIKIIFASGIVITVSNLIYELYYSISEDKKNLLKIAIPGTFALAGSLAGYLKAQKIGQILNFFFGNNSYEEVYINRLQAELKLFCINAIANIRSDLIKYGV